MPHPRFQAANDQYLRTIRDEAENAAYCWLVDAHPVTSWHIALMRACYAAASMGDEGLAECIECDGFYAVTRERYELGDMLCEFGYSGRDWEEIRQVCFGFVVGAARAWKVCGRAVNGR